VSNQDITDYDSYIKTLPAAGRTLFKKLNKIGLNVKEIFNKFISYWQSSSVSSSSSGNAIFE
jgi:hypothetical protein